MARKRDITDAKTLGESQRFVPRHSDKAGGAAAKLNRILQGKPDQKRRIDDSPATMRKNRAAAKRKK